MKNMLRARALARARNGLNDFVTNNSLINSGKGTGTHTGTIFARSDARRLQERGETPFLLYFPVALGSLCLLYQRSILP
jgi:hypothetical protein